jgi:hypothetical protein
VLRPVCYPAPYFFDLIVAVTCLVKDRDALLTFYDYPAESVFATVRHRTIRDVTLRDGVAVIEAPAQNAADRPRAPKFQHSALAVRLNGIKIIRNRYGHRKPRSG